MLGISPDTWNDAVKTMGHQIAATCIGVILQRTEHSTDARTVTFADNTPRRYVFEVPAIGSPSGYIRRLTEAYANGHSAVDQAMSQIITARTRAQLDKGRS